MSEEQINMDDYVGTKEAAKIIGCSLNRVRDYWKEGAFKQWVVMPKSGFVRILRTEVEEFAQERRLRKEVAASTRQCKWCRQYISVAELSQRNFNAGKCACGGTPLHGVSARHRRGARSGTMSTKKRFYIETNGNLDNHIFLEDRNRKPNDECDPKSLAYAPCGSLLAGYLQELCDLLNKGHEATEGETTTCCCGFCVRESQERTEEKSHLEDPDADS